jgi:hypothetical protein
MPDGVKDIQKTLTYKDNLIVLSSESGLFIFKVDKEGVLSLAQKVDLGS